MSAIQSPRARTHLIGAAIIISALVLIPSRFAIESFAAPKVLVLGLAAFALAPAIRWRAGDPVQSLVLLAFGFAVASWLVHLRGAWMGAGALAYGATLLILAASARDVVDRDPRMLDVLLDYLIAAAGLVAMIAVAEALGAPSLGRGARRPEATLGNRNLIGGFVAFALPPAIARAFTAKRAVRVATVALLVTVLVLCRTRSAWLGTLASLGATAILLVLVPARARPRLSDRRALAAVLAALVAGIAAATLVPWSGLEWREESPFRSSLTRIVSTEGTGADRIREHQVALAVIREHPWLGVGPRNWADASAQFAHAAEGGHAKLGALDLTPHSDPLRVLAETGLLGFATWVAAILFAAVQLFRRLWAGAELATWAAAASLSIAGVHMLFDTPFFQPATGAAIAVLAGVARALALQRDAPSSEPRVSWRSGFVLVAVASVAVLLAGLRVAAVLAARDDHPQALRASLSWFPNAQIQEVFARALVRRGECAEAMPELERALEWSPHYWHVAMDAAECAERLGDETRAAALRRTAAELEPHFVDHYRRVLQRERDRDLR